MEISEGAIASGEDIDVTGSLVQQTGPLPIDVPGSVGVLDITSGGTLITTGTLDTIGLTAGGTGTVVVDGSGSEWTRGGQIGIGVNGDGTLAVSNNGSLDASDEIDIAENAGSTGDFIIESGATVTSGGTYDMIGGNAGADGTVTVTGPGSTWNLTAALAVGNSGTGVATVSDGGLVSTESYITVGQVDGGAGTLDIQSGGTVIDGNPSPFISSIGGQSGSTGIVGVDGAGSLWNSAGQIDVGVNGAGTLNVNGGTVTTAGGITVGEGTGGVGTLDIQADGTVTSNGSYTFAGAGAGSDGTITVSGAGALLNGSAAFIIGNSGTGDATVSDDGVVNASSIAIGQLNQSDGTLTIESGGIVTDSGLANVGNTAGSDGDLAILAGGTLNMTAATQTSTTYFRVGLNGPSGGLPGAQGTVDVDGVGALLDVGANPIQIGGATGGTGTLTIQDGGTVIASSANSSDLPALDFANYQNGTATVTVTDAGSKLIANGYVLVARGGTATLTIENDARMQVNDAPLNGSGMGIGAGRSTGPSDSENFGGSGSATVTSGGVLDINSTISGITLGGDGVDGKLIVNDDGTVLAGTEMTVGTATEESGTIYGGAGTLDIGADGTVDLTAPAQATTYGFIIGNANSSVGGPTSAASGTVTVSGANAVLNTNGDGLAIGYVSNGTMTVSDGASVTTGTPNDQTISALSIGRLGNGGLTVTGEDTNFTANGGIYVGRGGTGTLTVENDATMDVLLDGNGDGYLDIGNSGLTNGETLVSGGSGSALVTTDGYLFSQTEITVGTSGDSGTLTINGGGTVEATTTLLIGNTVTVPAGGLDITTTGTTVLAATPFAGSGTVTVGAGGTLLVNGTGVSSAADLALGAGAGSTGLLNVVGTDARVDSNGGTVVVGALGTGTIAVGAGGTLNAGAVVIGAGATGSLSITSGGTVTASAVEVGISVGVAGAIGVAGGLLQIDSLSVGEDGSGLVEVDNGGGISVAEDGIGIGQAFGGTGTVIVSGFGSEIEDNTAPSVGGIVVGRAGSGLLEVDTGGLVTTTGGLYVGGVQSATPGTNGLVFLTNGGAIQTNAGLYIWGGSTLTVDATSGVDVGTSGSYVAGAVNIENGLSLTGDGLIRAATANNGTIYVSNNRSLAASTGGTLEITGSVSGTGGITLAAGSTLKIDDSIGSGQSIIFNTGTPETLVLGTPGTVFSNELTGLAGGDRIEFGGGMTITAVSMLSSSTAQVSYDGASGLTDTYDLTSVGFSGGADQFTYGFDSTTGDDYIEAVACFLPGTRIATPDGEVPVERLAVGDTVLTISGQARPLVWIGVGRVMVTRGRRSVATPVIVRKGALADNVPHHDLHITKGHSLFLDDVLIPVEFLVNHRSIIWDDLAQEVVVYHLELDTHDVLLANGAPAESYRDDGNRWLFQNANSGWDLPVREPCAPVLTGGQLVDTVWRRFLERSGPRPGFVLTQDPDLHLLVDGHRIDASSRSDGWHVFRLAALPATIRIVSRSGIPQEMGLARDPRSLGVALRRIMVGRGLLTKTIEASDLLLTDGFHEYEADNDIRWTDGDAALPACLFDGFSDVVDVAVRLGGETSYVDEGISQRVA